MDHFVSARRRASAFARAARRTRAAGASFVEVIILVGVVALFAVVGFRGFGTKLYSKIRTFGDDVQTLTPTKGGSSYCFAAGTPVATPDGLRPIESIHAGDSVLSRDERTGVTVVASVAETFVTPDAPLVAVHTTESPETIQATPGHRFYSQGRGWIEAQHLLRGEALLDSTGETLHVASVERLDTRATVYNFEVEGTHTYFVGNARVWVHNPNDCNGAPIGANVAPPAPPPAVGPGEPGWNHPDNPFIVGENDPGWNHPENPFLDPPAAPPPPPPLDPIMSGVQPPNVASVDPNAIYAALNDGFYKSNYDWSKRTELVNRLDQYAGKPAFVGYRYYGDLTPEVAAGIIANGSISGDGRTHGTSAEDAVHAFDGRYDTPNGLANAVNDHKNNGHHHSHFVSTSTNPEYIYSGFNNHPGANSGKVGLVIVTTQTGEKIYESASLAPHTNSGRMQGTNENGDYEAEHVYGGAVLPGSIIYGATAPMGMANFPPPRPWKRK